MRELDFMIMVWEDWESRSDCVECTECGIGLNFHPAHVAHIYGKGTEPRMRLDPENVIPMCLRCHDVFDKGLRIFMTCYYHVKKRMSYLKKKYGEADFVGQLHSDAKALEKRTGKLNGGRKGKNYTIHPDYREAS
jgi:hypothetical protein